VRESYPIRNAEGRAMLVLSSAIFKPCNFEVFLVVDI